MSGTGRVVRAAGVVPARVRDGVLQVALVHRPKYDDWSWPKGKLDRGEDYPSAAVRETLEETGLQVRLGQALPEVRYTLSSGDPKRVRYWTAEVVGGDGELEHEVDEVAWLSPTLAARRVSYDHDRDLLDVVVDRHARDLLATWPLLIVRHAHALPRSDWDGPDPDRPLSASGRRRAQGRITTLLRAYAPERLLTSPSVRCADTFVPYSEATGVPLTSKKGLSEEGFQDDPGKTCKHLDRLLSRARPSALCTHGPVLPTVLTRLADRPHPALEPAQHRMLLRLRDVPMDKGEILACTMVGSGEHARLLAVERHRPT